MQTRGKSAGRLTVKSKEAQKRKRNRAAHSSKKQTRALGVDHEAPPVVGHCQIALGKTLRGHILKRCPPVII